ncbi:MAG TPA: SpoIIE family protein phosphatase [Terriglobales bacterium]|nr:SpoIIE family protein phosphatase [Terriglobales bacterium]
MQRSDLALVYCAARVGGDFFDCVPVGPNRLVFALLDIAGERDQALNIAAAAQDTLRTLAPQLFAAADINEADAVTDLVLGVNQAILSAAGGVRCAPGIVACYNEPFGMLTYVNAGSVPALLRSDGTITTLEAGGLPLGLFSHATHDAQVCVLSDSSSLLLASRGLLEVKAGGEEYGIERLRESLRKARETSAHDLCSDVLAAVGEFMDQNKRRFLRFGSARQGNGDWLGQNDVTTVALLRCAARTAATVG